MNSNFEEARFDLISEEEFPFDACITCDFRSAKRCAGPNASGMNASRRCDFFQKLQRSNKNTMRNGVSWSYDYIAAQTNGISRSTVIRCITDVNYVPGVDTYSEVFRVLFDGSVNQYPCGIHSQEKEIAYVDSPETLAEMERIKQENEAIRAELSQLRSNIGRTHDFQEKELAEVRAEASAKAEAYEADIAEYKDLVALLKDQIKRKDDYIDRLAIKAGI